MLDHSAISQPVGGIAKRKYVMRNLNSMADYLVWAMEDRRPMTNSEIYKAVKDVCLKHKRPLPDKWEAEIRQTLQAHCASRPQYKGGRDLFVFHRRGLWSCKTNSTDLGVL
jgi:hypothetical protein